MDFLDFSWIFWPSRTVKLYFSAPVDLYTVFWDPKTLVKNLAKNLVKNLVKILAKNRGGMFSSTTCV